MPKRRRPDPGAMSGPELLRSIASQGRRMDKTRADELRYAQFYYDQHGASILEKFPAYTVDDRGRVHVPGEHQTWANGFQMLALFANIAEHQDLDGPGIAAHLEAWAESGCEPAGTVIEVVRDLARAGDLSPAEVAARLREQAVRIEREAMEADR